MALLTRVLLRLELCVEKRISGWLGKADGWEGLMMGGRENRKMINLTKVIQVDVSGLCQ